MKNLLQIVAFLTVFMQGVQLSAQLNATGWGTRYPAVEERSIVETKWRYTYAIHLESNTIIHQAINERARCMPAASITSL